MSPENTHKLVGLYMEVVILGACYTSILHAFCFFKLFPIGCIGIIIPGAYPRSQAYPCIAWEWGNQEHVKLGQGACNVVWGLDSLVPRLSTHISRNEARVWTCVPEGIFVVRTHIPLPSFLPPSLSSFHPPAFPLPLPFDRTCPVSTIPRPPRLAAPLLP